MSVAQGAAKENGLLAKLQKIQIGGEPGKKVKKKDLVNIIRNLNTLVNNGVSIPQALDTLLQDPTYKKYRKLLKTLADTVKTGGTLSSAMKKFPDTFPQLFIHQIQVGEQAGTIQTTLLRIVDQLENASKMKSFIIKKTTYPALLVVAGTGSVTFMLTSVIPTFQKMYEESGATLPGITTFMIQMSEIMQHYGLMIGGVLAALVTGFVVAMKKPQSRQWIDRNLLRIPLLGSWLRNLAILQFVETLGNLLESGFNLVDALPASAKAVNNRYMRARLLSLNSAIRRGERFSMAMERESDLFPPVVKQLVVVGERTGRLGEVTAEIRDHLRTEVEKSTSAMMGAIEPVLTAGLAFAIGGILLAVYLPMFDMIGNTSK